MTQVKIFVPISFVRLSNRKVKSKPEKYAELEKALLGARLPMTIQRLIAISTFYSYVSLVVGSVVGIVFFYKFIPPAFLLFIFKYTPFYDFALQYYYILSKIYVIIGLVAGLIAFRMTKYLILSYPYFIANRRKSEIDLYLPHAINMMYGMAVGGSPAYEIIKTIATSEHLFGEVSKEFGMIVEMVEIFKDDMYTAMRFVRDSTPSKQLSNFMDNFIFILQGGGKVSEFLKGKSQEYIEEQEVAFESYIEFMGLIAEMYLSLFVLMPLFLLVILVVMKMMGQEMLSVFRDGIIIILPIASYMLIFLIQSAVPSPKVKLEEYEETYELIKVNTVDVEKSTFTVDRSRRFLKKIKRFILHPFKEGVYTIQFRIIIIHLFIVMLPVLYLTYKYFELSSALVISLSVLAVPLILLIEIRDRMLRRAEENIPDIFAELAMLNEAGLSIFEGLRILASTEMGILTKEISIVRRELEWGVLVPKAFIRMGLRLKSDLMARVVPIVVKALETAPTIKDAFNTVSRYASSEVRFKRRLRSNMLLYVVIVYMSIAIFLFVSYIILKNFLTAFAGIETGRIGGGIEGMSFAFDLNLVEEIFFQVTMVVSIFSGLIAGAIGEGKVTSGLKHSYIFAIATYVVFFYLI